MVGGVKKTLMDQQFLEQQICDFSKMVTKGSVEIKPINPKRFTDLSFKSFVDPQSGITYGIPAGKDRGTGEIVFKRIRITGSRYYNLTNKADAMEWHVVKHHERVKGSPLQRGIPLLYVYDVQAEAAAKIEKIRDSRIALDIADRLDGTELLDFARTLGISPETNDILVVKQMVMEKAHFNGRDFVEAYSGGNRDVIEVFKRAEAAGMIKNKIGVGYVYNETLPLGTTEASAILYFSKQRDVLMAADSESKIKLGVKNSVYAATVASRPAAQRDAPVSRLGNAPAHVVHVKPATEHDFAVENMSQAANAFEDDADDLNEENLDNLEPIPGFDNFNEEEPKKKDDKVHPVVARRNGGNKSKK